MALLCWRSRCACASWLSRSRSREHRPQADSRSYRSRDFLGDRPVLVALWLYSAGARVAPAPAGFRDRAAVNIVLKRILVPTDLEISWVIGPYSLLYGFTLLALALRLRQLAFEIAQP